MKKLITYISIFTLFMLSTALAPTAAAIGASPLRMQLQAAPGETVEGYVIAQNTSEVTQEIVLTKGDFRVREDESMQFLTEVDPENQWSLQEWVELSENNIVVDAGEMRELRYKITVPEDAASQSYYGVVFVGGAPVDAQTDSAGVGISINVAHLVLLEVTGDLHADIELTSFSINEEKIDTENKEVRLEAVVYNSGNTHTAPGGTIVITDAEQNIIEEITLNEGKFNSLPSRNKTMVELYNYGNLEPGNYYAYLDGELAAEMPFEITEDGEIVAGETRLNRSLENAVKGDNALGSWGNALGLVLIAIIFMLIASHLKCRCGKTHKGHKKGKKKIVSMLFIAAVLGNMVITHSPNVSAQDLVDVTVDMTVDVGQEASLTFDGCWHYNIEGLSWSYSPADTTANLKQPGDRETGAPTGDQYGWYDTAGDSPNANILPSSGDAFGYDDCRIKVTARNWSNYEITLYGDSLGFDNGSGEKFPDMDNYTGSDFNFILDNENPSTPYPGTDGEHGFFIVDKSAGITQTFTDDGPGDVYFPNGETYDATDCSGRPCYHHLPDGVGNAVTIIDEGAGDLEDDTFVLRFGVGTDFLVPAYTYGATITITLNTTP
jgi:hypothetical protein